MLSQGIVFLYWVHPRILFKYEKRNASMLFCHILLDKFLVSFFKFHFNSQLLKNMSKYNVLLKYSNEYVYLST